MLFFLGTGPLQRNAFTTTVNVAHLCNFRRHPLQATRCIRTLPIPFRLLNLVRRALSFTFASQFPFGKHHRGYRQLSFALRRAALGPHAEDRHQPFLGVRDLARNPLYLGFLFTSPQHVLNAKYHITPGLVWAKPLFPPFPSCEAKSSQRTSQGTPPAMLSR